jgi:acetylornithine deacetylase
MRFTALGRAAHSAYPEQGENAIHHAMSLVQAFERHHQQLQAATAPGEGVRTCTVNLIEGGEAINIVPARCSVSVDRRLAPGERPEAARAELEAVASEASAGQFRCETQALLLDPPLTPHSPAPLAELCLQVAAEVTGYSGRRGVNYSTDASNLAETGMEAVVLGPGDIAQAHSAEEWVAVEQVEQAAELYFRLARAAAEV